MSEPTKELSEFKILHRTSITSAMHVAFWLHLTIMLPFEARAAVVLGPQAQQLLRALAFTHSF
jgi:hypothetical protein